MNTQAPRTRLRGIDLARFLALAGMVLVHAQSDLVLPPLEAAAGREVAPPPAAWPLELVQVVFTDRARLLFLLLAGLSTSIMTRGLTAPGPTLLRRAAFLAVLGGALLVAGWSDLVLLFYAVLFVLAPLLLRLSDRTLLVVAGLLLVPAAVAAALDPDRVSDLTGVLLVLGEAVPLFCLGMAVGRLPLETGGTVRGLARAGAVLAAPGLVLLTLQGNLDLTQLFGPAQVLAATTSTAGLCLLVLAGCLHVGRRAGQAVLPALAATGAMPLTAYVGHALLFPALAARLDLSLGPATAIAAGYLLATVLFARAWQPAFGRGPVEHALRLASGPPR